MKIKNMVAISSLLALPASADIIISEYVEGGSYNKAIELYNTSNNTIDLSDYTLNIYFNGKTSASSIALTGTVASQQTYVLAHRDIASSASPDFNSTRILFNGDDAITLERNGNVIDSIGTIGQDPGSQWGSGLTSTKDNTMVRNSAVSTGDTNPFDYYDPSNEWTGFAKDDLSHLGSHTFDGSNDNGGGDNGGGDNGGGDNGGGDNGGGDNGGGDTDAANCGQHYTAISNIQGNSTSTPLLNETHWVEGIVTFNLQDSGYKGFFIQSAETEQDQDLSTSEGIFVYHSNDKVNVGDRVRIQATVSEYKTLTQLSSVNTLKICASEQALPNAKMLTLPLNDQAREQYEGMLVQLNNTLVTDTYNYGRYGQFSVASERLFNPTQLAAPGASANQMTRINLEKSIVVDDGVTSQNPDTLPAPAPELSPVNTLRSGDTVENLVGVLSYHFDQYQLFPTQPVTTISTNPRTSKPLLDTLGNIRVASFNVLNYFNGDGFGNGYPTPRGAKDALEFDRQRDKVLAALQAMDADVVGLMEIENDGYDSASAIADLVNGLNALYNTNEYAYVTPSQSMGSDDIAVGLIYKPSVVTLKNSAQVLTSANSAKDDKNLPLFLDTKNRPMLTQLFETIESKQTFAVAVNHLKSKGSDCDSLGDPNLNDGQGNCNLTRTRAAQAIAQFLNTEYASVPTLIIGDLNAYAKEDPLTTLANGGFSNLFEHFGKTGYYTYIYKGELGSLDHALANEAIEAKVVDIAAWPINADEPRVLDYSMQYQTALHHSKFYAPDMYRSSDHDPIVIELLLEALLGDFDQDQDVDKNDITLFLKEISSGLFNDIRYDFNQDNKIDRRDVRGLMALCTRSRCETE